MHRRELDRLVSRCRDPCDVEAGVHQGGFHLRGDKKIILDEQDARRFGGLLFRAGRIVAGEYDARPTQRRRRAPLGGIRNGHAGLLGLHQNT